MEDQGPYAEGALVSTSFLPKQAVGGFDANEKWSEPEVWSAT